MCDVYVGEIYKYTNIFAADSTVLSSFHINSRYGKHKNLIAR